MCSNGTRARINSKLVRLEGACEVQHSKYIISFNSKLVRLKTNPKAPWCGGFAKFQFQTGAIKRGSEIAAMLDADPFQFQTGAIKS